MTTRSSEFRVGATAALPMLAAVVPFGLVAGAAPAAAGYSVFDAVGMSTFVFAGASQLAMTDVLADGGSVIVAAMAALTINLRMLLYSASLAPHLAHEPLPRRLFAAFLTVDQNYALAISHWSNKENRPDANYMMGVGVLLGSAWVTCTAIGALVGNALPEDLPLEFAVPLVFLVLVVPILVSWQAVAASITGGIVAVLAAEAGAGPWSIMAGALSGIAAGTLVAWLTERGEPAGEATDA